MREITREHFKKILTQICNKETTADALRWDSKLPLWGHCAAVSLLAQNLYGGELMRASLKGTPFEFMGSHYWNKFLDGAEEDFTAPQFGNTYPELKDAATCTREYVLFDPKTGAPREIMSRYKLLCYRLAKSLDPGVDILKNWIYEAGFKAALDSPCQKMKFGCAVIHGNEVKAVTSNGTIAPLAHLCEPTCIRFNIQSRTDSLMGACGHAEEYALQKARDLRLPLKECTFAVIGLYPNGLPWLDRSPEFTCLLCARQLYMAGVGSLFFPVRTGWVRQSAEDAVTSALAYERGEREV